MSNQESLAAQAPLANRRSTLPGRGVWLTMGLALGALAVLHLADPIGDAAILNVMTLILGFIALMAPYVWFLLVSDYPRAWRIAAVGAVVAPVGLFFALYEIEGVSGALIPKFRRRGAPPRDAALEKLPVTKVAAEKMVDLATTTPHDFPQFLGPDRHPALPHVHLARDWEARPPKLLWRQPIGAGWSGFAVVNGFAVTQEQRGEDEWVACYEVATGRPRWAHAERGRHATVMGGIGPRATPTIHAGRVYATTALGKLLCLEGSTGEVLWRVDLLELVGSDPDTDAQQVAWGRSGAPLVVDGLVVAPAGGKAGQAVSLAAFDAATGALAWKAGTAQISYASPTLGTLGGVRQILSVNEGTATGHDPASGKILWEIPWKGSSSGDASVSQPVAWQDDFLLLSKGYTVGGKLFRLQRAGDRFAHELEWENRRALKTKFTNVAIDGEHAFALSEGVLECVRLTDGAIAWKGKRFGNGQLLLAGDVLLVMAEQSGEVAMIDASPARYQELGRVPVLNGQTWNTLCLAGPYLLVRNAEEAACYKLALRQAP